MSNIISQLEEVQENLQERIDTLAAKRNQHRDVLRELKRECAQATDMYRNASDKAVAETYKNAMRDTNAAISKVRAKIDGCWTAISEIMVAQTEIDIVIDANKGEAA